MAFILNSEKIVKRLAFIGIFGNIILSAFKLFAGIFGKSGAMVSDAVHSLSDVFATFIAFLGVKLSEKDPDDSHPYGHDRFECIAAIVLGLILNVDLLHTRYFGNKIYVDVEISVDRNLSLLEAHSIAESVHDKIEKKFENIKHVMVHVNPEKSEV